MDPEELPGLSAAVAEGSGYNPGNKDATPLLSEKASAIFNSSYPGDSLSKIAKHFYGNAGKYMAIFEANKPMLKDPDKIYPGQVLRIPPAG